MPATDRLSRNEYPATTSDSSAKEEQSMSRKWVVLSLTLLLAMLPACRKNDEGPLQTAQKREVSLPETNGKAVLDHITRQNDYHHWSMFPGKIAMYPGQHPHGAFLTTYVSDTTLEALENRTGQLPDGAIVVKENYSPEKELAAVTVMYRKAGYNPESGDWFWLKYDPSGEILAEGRVEGCINCHKAVEDNDWIYTGPVK
jgi:hypothetical protein